MAKLYLGMRVGSDCFVTVSTDKDCGVALNPRYDLARYTGLGFEWGCQGPGAQQLALAVLAEFLDDTETALRLHQDFMREVISHLRGDEIELEDCMLARWVIRALNREAMQDQRLIG